MTVPYAFGAATSAIPLSQLDSNFNTPITLGNTAIQLGNTVTTLNNMTLANVNISSGNVTITNVTVTTANATTVNTTTLIATTANVTTGNVTNLISGNVTLTGGSITGTPISGSTGSFTTLTTSGTVTLNGGVANGVAYLDGSKVLTTGSALTFDGTNLAIGASPTFYGGQVATAGSIAITDGNLLKLWNTGGTGVGGISSPGTDTLAFSVGSGFAEQMRLTSTGLGIGTSSIGAKLTVSGNNAIFTNTESSTTAQETKLTLNPASDFGTSGAYATLGPSIAGYNTAGTANSGLKFYYYNNGTQTAGATLDSSGNLGIGTSSPVGRLDLGTGTGQKLSTFVNGNVRYGLAVEANEWRAYATTGAVLTFGQMSGSDGVTFTERMRLDASGRQLIGLTSAVTSWGSGAAQQLQVTDNNNLYPGMSSYAFSTNANAGGMVILGHSANTTVGTVSQTAANDNLGYLIFEGVNASNNFVGGAYISATQTGAAGASYIPAALRFFTSTSSAIDERARITSAGELLVGTTSSSSTTGSGFKVNSPVAGHWDPAVVTSGNSVSYSCWDIYSTGAGAYRFYVTTTGVINATSTTITAISDQRLKENIQDIDVGIDAIMALKPRKFDWKAGKGKDKKGDRGWIAQEFEQVFPDMISEWKDPAPEGEEPYKAVNADLIPVLVKALQELKAEVDSLKAQLKGA